MELILHALIVAAITAAATGYVAGKVMEAKMNAIVERVVALEKEVLRIRERLHDWAPHIGWVDQQRRKAHDGRLEH